MGRFAKMQLIIVGIFGFLNVSVMLFFCIVMNDDYLAIKQNIKKSIGQLFANK